jgi:methylenetetrahydrofolate dehydrogenase (NADP+)/methenyltetrahydrofolate cyclohydrolase
LCQHYGVLETGKHVLVVGRSFLVGKPLACLFLAWDMTVTIAHSKSKQIKELSRQADIVVVAVGVAHLVDESWFDGLHKPVVIDVGIHRTEQGLCGGVYTDRIKHLVSAYTPVPGGVGPLTVASLFQNLCDAYEYSQDSGGVVQ